jgi:hypothetical protein
MPQMVLYVADAVANWTLAVTIIATIVAAIGAWAALRAAKYAKQSPTAEDLKRVESHTASTAERLEDVRAHLAFANQNAQEKRTKEQVDALLQRLHFSATGEAEVGTPLTLALTAKNPGVALTRIELLNESDNFFGTFDCAFEALSHFTAVVDADSMGKWFASGEVPQRINYSRAKVRVHVQFTDHYSSREFAIEMRRGLRPTGNPNVPVELFMVNGSC